MSKRGDYSNDAFYEAWRRGMNPNRINENREDAAYYNGISAEDFIRAEHRREQERQEQIRYEAYMLEEQEREYYARCEQEEQEEREQQERDEGPEDSIQGPHGPVE